MGLGNEELQIKKDRQANKSIFLLLIQDVRLVVLNAALMKQEKYP